MKKKIISLLLVFFVSLSSVNLSFADTDNESLVLENEFYDVQPYFIDGGVISGPMVATLATLAVAGGIVLTSDDDIYNVARAFYEKNKAIWSLVTEAFDMSVRFAAGQMLVVGNDFLEYFKNTFESSSSLPSISYMNNIPVYPGDAYLHEYSNKYMWAKGFGLKVTVDTSDKSSNFFAVGDFLARYNTYNTSSGGKYSYYLYLNDGVTKIGSFSIRDIYDSNIVNIYFAFDLSGDTPKLFNSEHNYTSPAIQSDVFEYDYTGIFDWNKIKDKIKDDGVTVGVPGNAGSLVGENVDVWNPTYDLPVSGVVSIPVVQNPSIALDGTTTFPNVDVETGEDVGGGTGTDTFPAFPSFGDSLDFTPLQVSNISEKFPFSLPWDIGRLLNKFDVDPVTPKFNIPFFNEKIPIDLSYFDELANIARFFILLGFILSLIFISTKLKG